MTEDVTLKDQAAREAAARVADWERGWGAEGGPSDWDLEEVEEALRAALLRK